MLHSSKRSFRKNFNRLPPPPSDNRVTIFTVPVDKIDLYCICLKYRTTDYYRGTGSLFFFHKTRSKKEKLIN